MAPYQCAAPTPFRNLFRIVICSGICSGANSDVILSSAHLLVWSRRPFAESCAWRIVISPIIPYDSPPCYHSSMRHLVVLFIHLIAVLTQLFQPGGVRSLVAESLLLKHQLLIVNRSRQRSPNLSSWDRILAVWVVLLVRPTRLLRSAIVLKPSTLLTLHNAII